MSEHTPLTEAEWLDLGVVAAQAIRDNLPLDAFADPKRLRDYSDIWGAAAKNAIRRHLAARTSTATAEPCEACDDCTALVIGPNTDGDPCPWCQTCGCHYLAHEASTATADTGLRERVAEIDPMLDDLREICSPTGDWGGTEWGDVILGLLDLLATPASTEDRADNEGTR